jgi:hypothetical protein
METTRPIYHITHRDNLAYIIEAGCLWSDRRLLTMQGGRVVIGFDKIKRRRLQELGVSCHPATKVGDYVPFYFCPRSPMLYVIQKKNADLTYKGGQEEVLHLVSSVERAIEAADGRPWAFSDGNAGARYTRFSNDLDKIDDHVAWDAVNAKYWSDPVVKEHKQAEFLLYESCPWTAIQEIGVINQSVAEAVEGVLASAAHQPRVLVKPDWYY